jgi:transglutaminase-like putative cysteine protease
VNKSSVRPTFVMDLSASSALALYSAAVAAGFARVFSGWDFLDNLLVIVLVGHGSSLILRRLHVSAWLAVPATVLVMVWTLAAIHYRFTFAWGLPTSDTWTLFRAEIDTVQDQFSVAIAPVLYGAGWDMLAAIGLAIAVLLADVFAFRAYARAEALVPGGVLFVFIGALGSDRLRVPLTVILVAAGIVATIVLRAYHSPARSSAMGRQRTQVRLLVPAAVAGTITIALVAGFIGPRLPGADAAPVYETRGRGGGVTEVISPLVDIRSRLTNRSESEMFVVQTNLESYWRSSALPRFDGTTWGLPERNLEGVGEPLTDPRPGTEELRQQIRIVNLGGSLVPAAPDPREASGPNDLRWVPETSTLVTVDDDLATGDVFTITSASPRFDAAELAATTSTDAGDPIYLELPGGLPSIVEDTAAEVTADATNSYEAALALQNWFQDEFDYSLDVQPGHGNNAIESFLRERVGYCEQFAGTYAAMMRTVGVPSRVAVGFTSGKQISEGTYSVLGKNAHAWPEVWFDGLGWVPFEPTPGRGAPAAESYTGIEPQQDTSGGDGNAEAENTEIEVAPTIPNGSADETQAPNLPEDVPESSAGAREDSPQNESRLGQFLVVLILVALALGLPATVRWWRLRRTRPSTEQQLARLWRRSLIALEDVGVPQAESDTPLETAAATAQDFPIAARPIRSLAEVVTEAAYRPLGTDGYDVVGSYGSSTIRDCRNWCRQVERAVRDTITVPERIRRYFTQWG